MASRQGIKRNDIAPEDMHLHLHLPSNLELPGAPADVVDDSAVGDCASAGEIVDEARRKPSNQLPPEALAAPRITAEVGLTELASLSERELHAARADMLGRRPSGCLGGRVEEAVDALEAEMGRMCRSAEDGKGGNDGGWSSLLRARRALPFLAASSHARLFLFNEDLDAERTARRMARYWNGRERLHGDAAFQPDPSVVPPDEEIARIAVQWDFSPASGRHVDLQIRYAAAKFLREWERRKCAELDREVERLPSRSKAAFLDARSRRPDFVYDVGQKLLFLRGTDYDPKFAARRMVNYWDMKYYLFGSDNAFEQGALNEVECPELMEGIFHLLPGTDAFGRGLVFYRIDKLPHGDRAALKRIIQVAWFALHTAMANRAVRRKGLVLIVVLKEMTARNFTTVEFINRMGVLLYKSIPVKIRALHNCMPPESWWFRIALSVAMRAIGREGRSRIQFHTGKEEEVLTALEGKFGISREQLPSVLGGTLDPNYIKNWLENR